MGLFPRIIACVIWWFDSALLYIMDKVWPEWILEDIDEILYADLRGRKTRIWLTVAAIVLMIACCLTQLLILKKAWWALYFAFLAGFDFNSLCYQIVKYRQAKKTANYKLGIKK
jgi:hypothetical protein